MSSLMDKLRTLINAQVRGPRKAAQPPPVAQPQSPAIGEVTDGRARKPRAEVSETAPQATARQAPAPQPAVAQEPAPPPPAGHLDKGRVADLLKSNRKQ